MHFHRDLLASCDTFAAHVLRPRADDVFIGSPPLAFTFGLGGACCSRCGSARRPLLRRASPPGALLRRDPQRAARRLLHRADRLPRLLKRTLPGLAAHLRQRRRAAPRGDVSTRGRGDRHRDHRRHRLDRDAAHLHRRRRRDDPPRRDRASRSRATRRAIVGEDMRDAAARRGRPARGARPDRLPLPRRPAPGASTCRDGWNLTGDAFRMDEDGYFWFQARTDDMIVSVGLQHLRPRGRSRAARAPGRRRVRRRRRAR